LPAEIFWYTTILFKNVDALERIALYGSHGEKDRERTDEFSHAGIMLRSLTEYNVRSMCGAAVYGAGLKDYVEGRVSGKKFWKNTLSGKIDENGRRWLSGADKHFFEPTITLERSSNRPRISGACACSLASEGSLCPHVAALMIAWVRKRQEFVEEGNGQTMESEFLEARRRVSDSLREVVTSIENGSSRSEDLFVLQKAHSKLRVWAADVKEVTDGDQRKYFARKFSETLNSVSFVLMSAIETKYGVGATELYNKTTVSTFARALELFVNSGHRKSTDSIRRKKTSPVSSNVSRSWDTLLEEFARR
jgi:hypothetical protein